MSIQSVQKTRAAMEYKRCCQNSACCPAMKLGLLNGIDMERLQI
jgi:hypothetical protein